MTTPSSSGSPTVLNISSKDVFLCCSDQYWSCSISDHRCRRVSYTPLRLIDIYYSPGRQFAFSNVTVLITLVDVVYIYIKYNMGSMYLWRTLRGAIIFLNAKISAACLLASFFSGGVAHRDILVIENP